MKTWMRCVSTLIWSVIVAMPLACPREASAQTDCSMTIVVRLAPTTDGLGSNPFPGAGVPYARVDVSYFDTDGVRRYLVFASTDKNGEVDGITPTIPAGVDAIYIDAHKEGYIPTDQNTGVAVTGSILVTRHLQKVAQRPAAAAPIPGQ